MTAPERVDRVSTFSRMPSYLAGCSLVAWVVSLFAPVDGGGTGAELMLLAFTAGWAYPSAGAWAALANFVLLWIGIRVLAEKRTGPSMALCVLLPCTSPGFWDILGKADAKAWGVHLWLCAIFLGVLAGVLARYARPASVGAFSKSPATTVETSD